MDEFGQDARSFQHAALMPRNLNAEATQKQVLAHGIKGFAR